jgi:hypothetical protein
MAYGYPLLPDDGAHRAKRPLVDRALDAMVRERIGQRMDLELEADFDDVERRNAESGD